MNIAGIQSGMIGMALFDSWIDSVEKARKARKVKGSPLVAAASEAFEAYIHSVEVAMGAQIAGVAVYALNPGGGTVKGITSREIAPFLALNIMA